MRMRKFTAIVHHGEPDEGGFWAACLEVPGANGQGETGEECLRNLTEAIHLLRFGTMRYVEKIRLKFGKENRTLMI
jgi:predicted RNase H-like HicB family nuclease